jgi:hypothetical protein
VKRGIDVIASNSGVTLAVSLVISIGCAFGAKAILIGKGRSGSAGFCLGLFLGLIGLLIAAVLSPARQPQQMGSPYGSYPGQPGQGGQWAPDPFGRHQFRFHDGMRWTESVSTNGVQGHDPATATPVVAAPAQWGPDPYGRHELRYFDGANWTASISDRGVTGIDQLG